MEIKLGMKVRDRVSKFEGIVDAIAHHLNGCHRASVTPTVNKEGKLDPGYWFDIVQLDIIDDKSVMEPVVANKGGPPSMHK